MSDFFLIFFHVLICTVALLLHRDSSFISCLGSIGSELSVIDLFALRSALETPLTSHLLVDIGLEMRKKRKQSGEAVLQVLRGQTSQNDETLQDLHQQSINNQFDDQFLNVDITNSPINDDLSDPSLSPNEVQLEEENEPLLVKVKDICTGETITRKMVATQVWHLEKTKKVLEQINGNGQGNDSGSNLLVRFLGQLAQKSAFCPVSVERWDEMSNDSSIEQWKCIEDHFEFDYAAGIKWVRSTLGDRWKAYKYKLRCHYFLPNKSKDEILATLPPGVDHVEWAAFVHHYKKETMQKLSEQNSKNRKNLKVSHAGGSKSNARRAHQMEQKLGRPVCRSEVKLSTLLKKNGNYVNEEGKVMADKISENLSEDQERVATKGVPSKINAYPDDAIGKLCGPEHAGRVRVLGLGVSPTYVFTNHMHFTQFIQTGSSSQMNVENFQNKVVDLEEKLEGYEETKQQLTQTTEELTQTKEKLAQATTKLTKVERFLQHKYGDELSMFDL